MEIRVEDLVRMYRIMRLSRAFDEKVMQLFAQGETRTMTPHLGPGEEAVSVGAFYGLKEHDIISPHYRGGTAAWFVRGMPVVELMAIYLGRKPAGLGSQLSLAFGHDLKLNVLGASSSNLGGSIEIAVGAALAAKLRGTGQVVVCGFGDGTTNRGNFHEGLNLAAVFKLPIVFICQNNQWAMNTRVQFAVPVRRIAERAASYAFPGLTVDGNDVVAVHMAVQGALQWARGGLGPSMVEAVTYRCAPHSGRDFDQYRSEEERQAWRARCPIDCLAKRLQELGVSAEELQRIAAEVDAEIAAAVAEVQRRPIHTLEQKQARQLEIYREIYA